MRLLLRFLGFLFAAGTILFLVGVGAAAGLIWHFSKDLPDYSQLQDYEPPVMTRVHASDGSLLAEYAKERRLYLPIQAIPKRVIDAFLAAEDKNFYEHGGIDFSGMARAAVVYAQNYGSNRRPQGASTITQQVAKNFLLTNEVSFTRKIKEALLAMRIERTYSKDKILELYLNEIYLGLGAYGIAAASLVYFDKSVNELTISEAAYLAALPKAPTTLHPVRNHDRAVERRNYVVDRLLENGWIKQAEADEARKDPLKVVNRQNVTHTAAGEYFAEEVRRELFERYGEKKLYEGGLSVRTTLDPKLQVAAKKVLSDAMVAYDEKQGYRGPITKLDLSGDWGPRLADVRSLSDIPWRMAVVLETSDQSARIGFQPGRELGGAVMKERNTGIITVDGVRWAKPAVATNRGKPTPGSVAQVLSPGDVIYVDAMVNKDGSVIDGQYRLRQLPEVSGGMVVMDPHTGRVLAMAGGFSFDQSQFNRATQAYRQPGSSFKPIVYSAALDNGYTPSTVVMDAPLDIAQGPGQEVYRPGNYDSGKFYGPTTLRNALKRSLNTVTVRLAQDIGMPLIGEYAKRFGVYDEVPNFLSYALGAGETTVLRMATAYSMLDNAGKRIKPTLIDRIQDRYGHTIFKHDTRECRGCDAQAFNPNTPEPSLVDHQEQVLDPMTAYQITSLMEGVVTSGTAAPAFSGFGKPIAGKTGTTNDWKDAWFIGFSPDLTCAVYIGYDKPRTLGRESTGGHLAAPIARSFFNIALADKPGIPFKVPAGIKLIRVDSNTGMRAGPGDGGKTILEAFKPGTAPPDNYSVIGVADADGRSSAISPDMDRTILRPGTGGLY